MPLFVRHRPPPGPFADYKRYKPFLRQDFRFQCAYCNISEGYRKGSDIFGVDHFRPRIRFPELAAVYANLYYCCANCNSIKGQRFPDEHLLKAGICYVDPCSVDPFLRDLFEERDGLFSGLTSSGRFTIDVIRLNREECRRFRFRRQQSAERITRLRSVVAALDPNDDGSRLAADALLAAQAEWDECYGSYPRMPPAE